MTSPTWRPHGRGTSRTSLRSRLTRKKRKGRYCNAPLIIRHTPDLHSTSLHILEVTCPKVCPDLMLSYLKKSCAPPSILYTTHPPTHPPTPYTTHLTPTHPSPHTLHHTPHTHPPIPPHPTPHTSHPPTHSPTPYTTPTHPPTPYTTV